jgi:hypothetical protein
VRVAGEAAVAPHAPVVETEDDLADAVALLGRLGAQLLEPRALYVVGDDHMLA